MNFKFNENNNILRGYAVNKSDKKYAKIQTQEPETDALKQNILIVDDHPINLHLLSQVLSKRGYKVRPTRDGKLDRKSTRLNSSHRNTSRMPSSA